MLKYPIYKKLISVDLLSWILECQTDEEKDVTIKEEINKYWTNFDKIKC